MAQINPNTLGFLTELRLNNDRDWFNANKTLYEEARGEFVIFIDHIIRDLAAIDPAIGHKPAKDCVFRIYRDVRFSSDKSPYKTHFGAFLSPAVSKTEIHSFAGYYIHIEPGGASFIAGGAYMPAGDWLKNIRKEIYYNGDRLAEIMQKADFTTLFGKIDDEKLKKPPAGYPADHPHIELIRLKSFTVTHSCSDVLVTSENFAAHCLTVLKALVPFNRFFNELA